VKLGAERKKVVILIVLLVIALAGLYMNMSGDSAPSASLRTVAVIPPVNATVAAPAVRARGNAQSNGEFRPRVIGTRPDDKADPASIDPELKLDLLAKVQAVEPIEAGRNLFQFGAAPVPTKPMPEVPKGVPPIPIGPKPATPQTSPEASKQPPPQPQAAPINLKYYGYKVSKADGHKEAFLLDGDDIVFAQENQTVKQRYKIVRIALNSITIEDTQSNSTQTLNLQDMPS
jgi:hypothetical protein